MLAKQVCFLLLLLTGHFAMAQHSLADTALREIDSLILYGRFNTAQKKADSLLQKLPSGKKSKEQGLETRFRQIVILDRQDGSSAALLKMLQKITDEAEAEKLHSLCYRVYLITALAYEKAENLDLTAQYLDKAYEVYRRNNLEAIYSTYCIRRSSYYRFINKLDSSFYYAKQAKEYAEKYHNETDLTDSYILLGNFAGENGNYDESLKYKYLLLNQCKKFSDSLYLGSSYNNIARTYQRMQDYSRALLYNDSAYAFYHRQGLIYKFTYPEIRYKIFEGLGNTDSAYHYFKQYHNDYRLMLQEDEKLKTKELEEQYQNGKKEATIKNKNQQLFFIITLLGVITVAAILLIRKNKRINFQNKVISKQVEELMRTLDQKQVLLSELQHRVKNNLQHVISILEIQKESVDFNNIEELIRGNQNRIHSMALLHKKLNVAENVNDVDLKRYVTELSELVKESYDSHKKTVTLNIKCTIETISIEKALPLGLIIVELVSNSMKHAFKKRNIGIIDIEISKNNSTSKLYYADNGEGFDFNKTSEKGLGQEIVKGLIDQLDGTTEADNKNGFELTIYFK